MASLRPVAYVGAPGHPLSIDTLTLTPKVTVSGQGHENVEISSAFFSASSRCTGAQFRALVRVRNLRRIVQLQCRGLTPSNRGVGVKKWRVQNGGPIFAKPVACSLSVKRF